MQWRIRKRRCGTRVTDDLAIGDLDLAVGMLRHFAVMGDQDDGIAFRGQLFQQRHNLPATAAVQSPRRLVRQDNLAAVHQCPGDGYPLLLAAGKLARLVAHTLIQPQPLQQCRGPGLTVPGLEAGITGGHLHVFTGGNTGQQVVTLEYKTEGFPTQTGQAIAVQGRHVPPIKAVLAGRRPVQAAKDVHQGRFAGTRCPHNGHEFAAMNAEVDAPQHGHRHFAVMVGAGDVPQFNQWVGHAYILIPSMRREPLLLVVLPAPRGLLTTRSPSFRPSTISACTRLVTPTVTPLCSGCPLLPST